MKNYKVLYEKEDENIGWEDSEGMPEEKKLRKIRWERRRRDKLSFDRHMRESLFRREDL
jgi:hypothetical protein